MNDRSVDDGGSTPGSLLIPHLIAESEKAGETHWALKHLAMGLVHRAMVECYGANYAIRCMECTMGIHRLLTAWGMDGPLVVGALCIPSIEPSMGYPPTWAGFWGKDHHFWGTTKFKEMVDLSMSQNHLHPVTIDRGPVQPPAIWIDLRKPWIRCIQHLPLNIIGEARSTTEQDRMDAYLTRVDALREEAMAASHTRESIQFTAAPLVMDAQDLNRLSAAGDPWCAHAHVFMHLPFPPWVADRIKELEAGSMASRLEQPDGTLMEIPERDV